MPIVFFAPMVLAAVQVGNVSAADIVWSGAIRSFESPPPRIILEGYKGKHGFEPSRAVIPGPQTDVRSPVSVMVGQDIVVELELRPFGIDERASSRKLGGGRLQIDCRGGNSPAGILIGLGNKHLPREISVNAVIEVYGESDFELALIDRESPETVLASTKLLSGVNTLNLPQQSWDDEELQHGFRILCPSSEAGLTVASFRIEAAGPAEMPASAGAWLWSADKAFAMGERLDAELKQAGISDLFIQVEVKDAAVQRAGDLRQLTRELAAKGISLIAVEGDPQMVTATGRAHALSRAAVIRRFNEASGEDSRIAGFQYDIEPYLLDEFGTNPAAIWNDWRITVEALAGEIGQPIAVVVPFWMIGNEVAYNALESARNAISEIVVMAYRTDEGSLFAISEPWLAYGVSREKPVRIGLEHGPIMEEVHRTYQRAEAGPLSLKIGVDGIPVVTLGKAPLTINEADWVYDFSHEVLVDPGRVSFMGQTEKMMALVTKTGPKLASWPSFDGFAFHELLVGSVPIQSNSTITK